MWWSHKTQWNNYNFHLYSLSILNVSSLVSLILLEPEFLLLHFSSACPISSENLFHEKRSFEIVDRAKKIVWHLFCFVFFSFLFLCLQWTNCFFKIEKNLFQVFVDNQVELPCLIEPSLGDFRCETNLLWFFCLRRFRFCETEGIQNVEVGPASRRQSVGTTISADDSFQPATSCRSQWRVPYEMFYLLIVNYYENVWLHDYNDFEFYNEIYFSDDSNKLPQPMKGTLWNVLFINSQWKCICVLAWLEWFCISRLFYFADTSFQPKKTLRR
jgi:hypothetical protein